jgi:hypothetical protein
MVSVQKLAKSRVVAVNDRGQRIGEDHPRAVLTDAEVELMLELRAELKADGSHKHSMSWLAHKFDVSKSCVAKIIWGDRRGQTAASWRGVRGKD